MPRRNFMQANNTELSTFYHLNKMMTYSQFRGSVRAKKLHLDLYLLCPSYFKSLLTIDKQYGIILVILYISLNKTTYIRNY